VATPGGKCSQTQHRWGILPRRSNKSFSVESDCSFAVELINGAGPNISAHAFRINVIRELLRERNSKLVKITVRQTMLAMNLQS
jgi:hypothetical protein